MMAKEWMVMLSGISFAGFLATLGFIGLHLEKKRLREGREKRNSPTPPAHP